MVFARIFVWTVFASSVGVSSGAKGSDDVMSVSREARRAQPGKGIPSLRVNGEGCQALHGAVVFANRALAKGTKCRAWLDAHRGTNTSFKVTQFRNKPTCQLTEIPTWTFPWTSRIGVCQSACKLAADHLAILLLHEVGHHYCPKFAGRENCAIEMQTVCADELR